MLCAISADYGAQVLVEQFSVSLGPASCQKHLNKSMHSGNALLRPPGHANPGFDALMQYVEGAACTNFSRRTVI